MRNDYSAFTDKKYSYFRNSECEYFPCHETERPDDFNCLFCFCPLYFLGEGCGGDYIYKAGVKDCSGCVFPHKHENYGTIIGKLKQNINR